MRILLVLFLVASATTAAAAEVDTTSEVTSVVVFPDRARVTRTAEVQLSKGSHDILVAGLPTGIDVGTLRAEGSGTAKAIIGSLDVRLDYGAEVRDARARQLLERVRALEDADKELADAADSANFELEFVRQLVSKSTVQLGKEVLEVDGRAQEADEMVSALGRRYRSAKAELRRVSVERRDLAAQLAEARAEYSALSGRGTNDFRVAVAVQAKTAGKLELHLTYTVYGASWSSTYDARLQPDAGIVEMTYGAWVQQSTAEDWSNAALTLSTAQPALGLQAPPLQAWVLKQYAPPRPTRSRAGGARRAEKSSPAAGYEMDDMDYDMESEEEVYEAELQVATAVTEGTSVEFAIPGRVSVPGDGTRKRVTIAAWRVEGVELEYLVTPATSTHVFQAAKFVHEQEWPLLRGELQAFMDDRYIGRSSLARVAPGDELRLPFGVEERLVAERKLLEKGSGPKGAFGNKSSEQWTWSVEVRSLLDRAVTVEVREVVPVSEYSKYIVKVLDGTAPEPDEEKDRGVLVWRPALEPGGSWELTLEYAVAFPTDERPWGL